MKYGEKEPLRANHRIVSFQRLEAATQVGVGRAVV